MGTSLYFHALNNELERGWRQEYNIWVVAIWVSDNVPAVLLLNLEELG